METKHEVIADALMEYLNARTRKEKGLILNRLVKTTHMHRKAVIRRLRVVQLTNTAYGTAKSGRGRRTYYTPDVTAALKDVWDASNGLCGELLHSTIAEYVTIFQKEKVWTHSDEATGKLLAMSEMTVKRRVGQFERTKRKGQGFSATSPSNIKTIIPISVGEWKDADPGVLQVDTVVHCGATLKGDLVHTFNATDVSTMWNILRAQWNKGEEATRANDEYVRTHLPMPYLRRHTDTGSEFINHGANNWALLYDIKLTRSRPYKKNDNMLVEERNGHIVRKYIGYIRLDCVEAVPVLNELYFTLNLYTNHFIPSRRMITSVREGAKHKKTYEKAKTPYRRVLAHSKIGEDVKSALRAEHTTFNPKTLLAQIEKLRTKLYDVQKKYGGPQI